MGRRSQPALAEVTELVKAAVIQQPLSMRAAARFAGISYSSFIRIAKAAGVYAPNPGRKGLTRPNESARARTPLEEYLVQGRVSSPHRLKRRLIEAGLLEEICGQCCIGSEWNGKPLVLQLDHIDGDRENNLLENLRLLCPNCHSQTATFAGKAKAGRRKDGGLIADDAIRASIVHAASIREALLAVGLVASGANYKRAQRIKAQMVKSR